jgi:hypothetical protein
MDAKPRLEAGTCCVVNRVRRKNSGLTVGHNAMERLRQSYVAQQPSRAPDEAISAVGRLLISSSKRRAGL